MKDLPKRTPEVNESVFALIEHVLPMNWDVQKHVNWVSNAFIVHIAPFLHGLGEHGVGRGVVGGKQFFVVAITGIIEAVVVLTNVNALISHIWPEIVQLKLNLNFFHKN